MTWAACFIESKFSKVVLEIGCGVGWHTVLRAQSHPDELVIGIEHTRNKFKKFSGRAARHSLGNLVPVHANAISWVTQEIPPESIDEVFILYPNLNVKNTSQRWFQMPFMKRLLHCLKPGGKVQLSSNSLAYIEEACELALSRWRLELLQKKELTRGLHRPRSHFEKKYLERDQVCWSVEFRKPLKEEFLTR